MLHGEKEPAKSKPFELIPLYILAAAERRAESFSCDSKRKASQKSSLSQKCHMLSVCFTSCKTRISSVSASVGSGRDSWKSLVLKTRITVALDGSSSGKPCRLDYSTYLENAVRKPVKFGGLAKI